VKGFDLFLLGLTCYGAGIFSAIGAMELGRWIGRRQARIDEYWRMR
jgi:hypothetical protein